MRRARPWTLAVLVIATAATMVLARTLPDQQGVGYVLIVAPFWIGWTSWLATVSGSAGAAPEPLTPGRVAGRAFGWCAVVAGFTAPGALSQNHPAHWGLLIGLTVAGSAIITTATLWWEQRRRPPAPPFRPLRVEDIDHLTDLDAGFDVAPGVDVEPGTRDDPDRDSSPASRPRSSSPQPDH